MKRSELFLRLTLWRTACAFLIALATLLAVGRAATAAAGDRPQDADVPARMLPLLRAIQSRELEELHQEKAARTTINQAGVELGTWYRIGPLRDQPPLLNWMENSASSFAHRFEVKRDALDGGGAPLLAKVYPAPNFPSTPDWWDALFASAAQFRKQAGGADQADLVMADFEGPDYGDWKVTGEAFGSGPARGALPQQMQVSGFLGNGLVNTYLGGDRSTGTLTSPPVKIERRFVNARPTPTMR
jgi:hypothetical protein